MVMEGGGPERCTNGFLVGGGEQDGEETLDITISEESVEVEISEEDARLGFQLLLRRTLMDRLPRLGLRGEEDVGGLSSFLGD